MNKRTDRIRSLFAQQPAEMLSADNNTEAARVSAGSVRAMKDVFSGIEVENEALRQKLAASDIVVDLDPALIDPSPVGDRFTVTDDPSYEALKLSIREHGQEIPILVRPHPTATGRYQTSYGHRRVQVARDLGMPVKAVVRDLDDAALVVSQGLENCAREDLSFIERAMFAARLEDAGHARAIVQQALAIDRAEASKLISVARAVPGDIILKIGKAPKIGRGRWQELADCATDADAVGRMRATLDRPANAVRTSDEKFALVLSAARRSSAAAHESGAAVTIATPDGQVIAKVAHSGREITMRFDRGTREAFAAHLMAELPALYAAFDGRAPRRKSR
jgi:ParB family chromosome partitioning protein